MDPKCFFDNYRDNGIECIDDCTCDWRDKQDYENICVLSHISHQFTHELATCLWQNAVLDFEDLELLFDFVRDRPSVLRYVRGVMLTIWGCDDFLDTSTSTLKEVCKCISENFDLNSVTIRLFIPISLVDNLMDVEKLKSWTPLFRSLRIREKFEVCLSLCNTEGLITGIILRDGGTGELETKLSNSWLPDTLRVSSDQKNAA
ncbi:hypothetical protein G7Y89_g3289 [Cudoniella acicularis]|uniref:Uncharacterized protein n=1 Tax=Cudoniella acicularis TaxID=354080 RepID=A0A8H4W8J0_9HELO|nr:hypothetical protein G7Y89_g3289 [Cudoniella acicularis]